MFDVTNPSMSQQPVGVGLQLSYSDGDGGNKIWYDNAITELIFDTNVDGVPGQTQNVEDYPMYVAGATLDSAIAQSTPSPCVENTITVTISCTVDLLAGCMPLFSLTGVTGSTTEDTLLLSVEYSSGASAWSLSGSWSKDSGALGVSLFAQDSADDTSIAANTDIVLSFKIFNPSSSQLTAPTTSLSLTLDDRIPDTDGYQTSFHDAEIHTSSTMTRPTDSNLVAMYVREVAISSTSVQQSNTYPCSENIITVAFTVSAQVAFFCANTITISGLVGVNDDQNVQLQQYSSVFSPSAVWNRVQEELVVTLVANLAGSTQYSFSVVLKNGPLWQSASAASLTEPAIIGSTVELNGAVNVIDRFAPSIATISASSTEPCGPNVITISFVPNIDVKASCDSPQENGEVQTGPVYLYIYGLTGSSTSSQALAVTPNVAGVFSNQGNWEKDVGSMRLYLQAGLTKDTEYELSFTILNGAFEFAGHNNINLTLPDLSASVVLDGTALQVDSSPAGSDNATDCRCNAGYTGPDGGECTACPAGTYKDTAGSAQCSDCPSDSASAAGSDNVTDCKCHPGYAGPDGSQTICQSVCGDGLKVGSEQCDDQGTDNGDGCSATCTVECGFDCGLAEPSVCTSSCGDGVPGV